MAQVNINGDPHDTHYRYKMPMILGKIEGKGNGIKTVISNIVEIAKSINRPPEFQLSISDLN
ncbi:hypothetical protein A3Q56_08385 [Intoshia linei]|uniref:Eukaryotic translation initiation factor 5 n=1 Tax=Intoshia linei TaxID=1819745 RepID=A0A177AQ31_9BILA|nr:hypothetical protein A3Q56_08385 [Intoshia linei]